MDPKIKDRMLKILALARGGVGGEKDNAERMLETLCKKHGVSLDELEGRGAIETHWFYVNSKHERRLIGQVVHLFVSDKERAGKCWTHKKRSRAIGFDLTPGEHAQVKVGFETYKAAWIEQQDLFFTAFIWKNRIYGLSDTGDDSPELTEEQKEKARRSAAMMRGIDKVDVLTRLEDQS